MSTPLVKATQEAVSGLLPLLERLEDREGLPAGTSPAHLRNLAAEAIRRDDLPADKLRGWLGFIQGVLVAQGHLDMDEERDRTRPIFHKAYAEEGMPVPPTVAVGEARGAEAGKGPLTDENPLPRYGHVELQAKTALAGFERWLDSGFQRGYFRSFSEAPWHDFPKLPSVSMLTAIIDNLDHGKPDGAELKARMDFMDAVLDAARKREKEGQSKMYGMLGAGQIAKFLTMLAVLAGAVILAPRSEFQACALIVAAGTAYAAGIVWSSRKTKRLLKAAMLPPDPVSYIPWLR